MSQAEKNYITPRGFKKLQGEFEHLTKVERPQVTKTVAWAASLGDRSENADYIYGKKRLREIDSRLRFLLKRLENIQVIDPAKVSSTKIQFGATVIISDDQGQERSYCIVGVDEIDLHSGLISWKSPIGRALIGKTIGDSIIVQTPKGEVEFEVLSLEYKELV